MELGQLHARLEFVRVRVDSRCLLLIDPRQTVLKVLLGRDVLVLLFKSRPSVRLRLLWSVRGGFFFCCCLLCSQTLLLCLFLSPLQLVLTELLLAALDRCQLLRVSPDDTAGNTECELAAASAGDGAIGGAAGRRTLWKSLVPRGTMSEGSSSKVTDYVTCTCKRE